MNSNRIDEKHMISKFQRFNSTLIILLVIFFSSGCVYYNTFYNARKAFNEAEKSRKKSIYKGGRINQAKYKLAIEKSLKVVEDSPNSKWYDDALYVLAVSYFYTKKYYQAERRFREIIANYGDSKYARETQIYLAKTKLELHEETDAMELFEIIFNSDYNRDFKAEAAMALGNFYYKEKNYQDAQKYFLAVRDSLGSKEEEKISQKFIADSYYNTFRFNEALGAYLQLLGMEPDKSEKYYIYYQAASCSFKLMKITDGMDYLQNLIDDEIYFDSLGVLKLLQAEGFEYDNDIEQAETVYREIAEQEDNRKVSGEANYRLGLIYQFDYDSLNEAKSFYDKTVELSRSSEYGRDAIQRSSDIGKLETFARTLLIDSSTTQDMIDEAAFAQYQLAELYWFKLNKPDTAILEMQYLIDSFPTSFDAPKAMIAISQMYREYKKDTVTADSILQKMLTEYPHSDFVPDALAALNLLETAADTGYANFYLNKAEYFLVDEENIDSARTYYQYLVDNFPDSKYYLQARFSLIWLMETYYNPGDSTVVFAYNDFIDSFPNTYWSQQAAKKVNYSPQPQMP
ncbi:MAG: tetratricopeptide repeat protein, partial [Candidatus Zixiibacteriota bacterium]